MFRETRTEPNQWRHGKQYPFPSTYHVISVPERTASTGADAVVDGYFSRYLRTQRAGTLRRMDAQPLPTAEIDHAAKATLDEAAVRDAEAVVERALADEHAAIDLRQRLKSEPLPTIEPADDVAAMLAPDEQVITVRDAVVVERDRSGPSPEDRLIRLVVTTARLILIGRAARSIPFDRIDEVSVAGEKVLVSLIDGEGLSLDAGGPRLLRLQIAAARSGIRT